MHILRLGSLGAVGDPPLSNDADLRAGYAWFPYMSGGQLLRMCPPDDTRRQTAPADALYVGGAPGCWIKNSRAWGQRVEPQEFAVSQPPSAPTTGRSWPPDPSGDKYRAQCRPLWDQGLASDPALRACLTENDYPVFYQLCAGVSLGYWSFADGAAEWARYVERKCTGGLPSDPQPTAYPPPPQPPGVPSPPPAPPPPVVDEPGQPTDVPPFDLPGGGSDLPVDGGSGMPTDSGQKKGFLRQVGPVVGIGLLAAIGLTLARGKTLKLTRKRKRR